MRPSRQLKEVLDKAWRTPFRTKSNFARSHADAVALAASAGFITTQVRGRQFGATWLITNQGLEVLNECC